MSATTELNGLKKFLANVMPFNTQKYVDYKVIITSKRLQTSNAISRNSNPPTDFDIKT